MPKIVLKDNESLFYALQSHYPKACIKLLKPLPKASEQRGHTCKLYALSAALNYAFVRSPTQHLPMMPRKGDSAEKKNVSLRERAKGLGSMVGEVYHGELLLRLASENGYPDSEIITLPTTHYIQAIKEQIDVNEAPIVFFDVDPVSEEPDQQKSQREHAAIVVGYFIDDAVCHFVLAQWGHYYYVNAQQLRASANQLARVRTPETFYKIGGLWRQVGDRLDRGSDLLARVHQGTIKAVTSPPNFSFKNKILLVKTKAKQLTPERPTLLLQEQLGFFFTFESREFIRLDKLINFLVVDSIRADSYSANDLDAFATYFNFKDELIALTRDTEVDESLEDDIHRQNPKRTRSITELVSNAIDANSPKVFVSIEDGRYQINDRGVGMSPEIIFRKLLIPKASTKEDAQDSIGQFGLGFYTALVHLNKLDDSVIVRTKTACQRAFRIEFRLINGKVCVNLSPENYFISCGTEITVISEQIKKESFSEALIKNIQYLDRTDVYINGCLANKTELIRERVSKTSIIIDDNAAVNETNLTLAWITFQTHRDKNAANTLNVVWNLDKALVSIFETRNQVRLDSKESREEVKAAIDFADRLTDEVKIKYFNAIASLVYNLQQHNASPKSKDNVFYYLQSKIKKLYGHKRQVPDISLLNPLVDEQTIVLHPLLIDSSWQKTIGFEPPEWHAIPDDKTIVYITKMNPKLKIKMIHDEHSQTIYLDEALYQPNDPSKLNLLFSLPPGVIKGSWESLNEQREVENATTSSKAIVQLDPPTTPYTYLYQTHGILAKYGDQFANSLSPEALNQLSQAATLMQIYPMQKNMLSWETSINSYMQGYYQLIPFTAKGRQFYLTEINTCMKMLNCHNFILLDHSFSQLFHRSYLLIFTKALQLCKNNKLEALTEVTLEKADRLLIPDVTKKGMELFDGEGRRCLDKIFGYYSQHVILNDDYFMIVDQNNTYLYNRENQLVVELPFYYSKISDKPLQIAAGWDSREKSCKGTYCVDTKKDLIPYQKDNKVKISAGLYLHVQCPFTPEKVVDSIRSHRQGNFFYSLFSLLTQQESLQRTIPSFEKPPAKWLNRLEIIKPSGNILFTYTSQKESDIAFIECDKINDHYFLTVQYADYKRELLLLKACLNDVYTLMAIIPNNHIIGYPARAYMLQSADNILTLHFVKRPEVTITGVKSQKNFGRYYSREFNYDPLTNEGLTLVKYAHGHENRRIIIDGDHIITLPNDFNGLKITSIMSTHDAYKICTKGDNPKQFIVSKNGKLLTQGNEVWYFRTKDYGYLLVDKHQILNTEGRVLFATKCITYPSAVYNLNLFVVVYEKIMDEAKPKDKIHFSQVIDHQGQVIISETTDFIHEYEGRLSYTKNGENYCITAKGHSQLFKYIYSTNYTLSRNEKINSLQYLYFYKEKGKCYLIDEQGNSMFAGGLQNCYTVNDAILTYAAGKPDNLVLLPLNQKTLSSPCVQENIRFLNIQQLSSFDYGACLRFCELNPETFQKMYPFMRKINYIPIGSQIQEFVTFFEFINEEVSEHQDILIRFLNLAYSIAGSYTSCNLANKLSKLYTLYGIYTLEDTYKELLCHRNKIIINPEGITAQEALIREMPREAGILIYYLFFDGKDLFSEKAVLLDLRAGDSQMKKILLIDLIVAQLLKADIANYALDAEFVNLIDHLTKETKKYHAERRLMHAVYHQAPPEKCLYLREFIQNALDAYTESKQANNTVDIDITITADHECVLSLRDKGVGMTLEQVFKYLLIPGVSSKRHAGAGKFIGGRGMGFFTAFHGAKKLLVKTSREEGKTIFVVLTPQYQQLKNNEWQVIDVIVEWSIKEEPFQGTLIQRISFEADPAHEAAKYHRAIGPYAKFIDRTEFEINLNGKKINDKLIHLLDFDLPDIGQVSLFKSIEKAITVGGLFVKELSDDLLESLPPFMKKVFDVNALVIQLPKNVSLNRAHNDFQDSEQFTAHLKRYLPQALYGAYLALFLKSEVPLSEIPYDFYNKIFEHIEVMKRRNPAVERDAFILNHGGSLNDYSKYLDGELLTDLLCYLNLIEYRENDGTTPKKESIVNLGIKHQQKNLNTKMLPCALRELLEFDLLEKKRLQTYEQKIEEIALFKNLEWTAVPCAETKRLNLFIELCQKITSVLTKKPIVFKFSTANGSALAYVSGGHNKICWNIINLMDDYILESFFTSYSRQPKSYGEFAKFLTYIIKVISHELTHIDDNSNHCSGTHNRSFYLRQRALSINHLAQIDYRELYKFYEAEFQNHIVDEIPLTIVNSVKAQLKPFFAENECSDLYKQSNSFKQGFFSTLASERSVTLEENDCNKSDPQRANP